MPPNNNTNFDGGVAVSMPASGSSSPVHAQQETVSKYDMRLPLRIDVAAALTYALGCISGAH
jgi:hypothetical protein